MEGKTCFELRFNEEGMPPYEMRLRTTEPKTEDEIRSLISYYAEINDRTGEPYSPVNILDDLCEEKGWTWEDSDYEAIVFEEDEW
jgi:hypothetical protein